MATVTDMVVIQGDINHVVGDNALLWEKNFVTNGRYERGAAILMLMVKGLTYANAPVAVQINNQTVGHIFPTRWQDDTHRDAAAEHWSTQIINVTGSLLKNGTNELQILAADFPEATGSNSFDDFSVRDVVCFFQKFTAPASPGDVTP